MSKILTPGGPIGPIPVALKRVETDAAFASSMVLQTQGAVEFCIAGGLSKREYMAVRLLPSILARRAERMEYGDEEDSDKQAQMLAECVVNAVKLADLLLSACEAKTVNAH